MSKLLLQILIIITLLGCAAPTFRQGVDAYEKRDYRTALKAFEPLAKQNNPIAQNYLGAMYYNGTNVTPKDYDMSARLFRVAADNGSAEAQYNLARLYQVGHGVNKDPVESLNLLNKSAKQGYPPAKQILARLQKGSGDNNFDWDSILKGVGAAAAAAAALYFMFNSDSKDADAKGIYKNPYESKPCGVVEYKGTFNCND